METKKSIRADLEHKKGIFLEVGLIIALGLVLAAFEWESPVKQITRPEQWITVGEDIFIKNTFFDEKKPAPVPVSAPVIRIVENFRDDSPLKIDAEMKPTEETPVYITPVMTALEEEKPVVEETPFVIVERMPEFPGGISALQEYLAKNIDFPETAVQAGIQGTVYVYFIVEKDGSISNIKTLRGIGGGCNEEAERVIGGMPKWKPGNQGGKTVRVSFNIPVIFKLK